jgi:hypothetical protein
MACGRQPARQQFVSAGSDFNRSYTESENSENSQCRIRRENNSEYCNRHCI